MNKLIEFNSTTARLVWDEAEAYLRKAINDEDKAKALTDLKGRVFAGMNTLWKIADKDGNTLGWGTTLLYSSDGITNVLQISLASVNELNLLIEHQAEFEVWAHKHKAHYIEVVGRLGWTKILKPWGFEHNYTSVTKRIFRELH